MPKAKELHDDGYKNLFATEDGQYFSTLSYGLEHAKNIDSEVFSFTGEDFANGTDQEPEVSEVTNPEPEVTEVTNPEPEPVQKKKVSKPKKK